MRTFLLFFLLLPFWGYSQCDNFEALMDAIEDTHFQNSFDNYELEALKLIPKMEDAGCWGTSILLHVILEECALHHQKLNDAESYIHKTEELLNEHGKKVTDIVELEYYRNLHNNNRGNYFYKNGEYEKVEKLYAEFINKLRAENNEEDKDFLAASHHFLGTTYKKQLRLNEAKNHLEEALRISQEIGGNKLNQSYKLLGDVYKAILQKTPNLINDDLIFNKAKGYFYKSLNGNIRELNLKKKSEGKVTLANRIIHTKKSLAELHLMRGENDISKKLIDEAFTFAKQHDRSQEMYLYDDLGDYFLNISNEKKAIENYKLGLEKKKEFLGFKNPAIVESYYRLGNAYLLTSKIERASYYVEKAEEILTKEGLEFTRHYQLVQLYKLKGDIQYKAYRGIPDNEIQLKIALHAYQEALRLLETLQNSSLHIDDKADQAKFYKDLFDNAIDLAIKLGANYKETAFYFSEKEKAIKLLAPFKYTNASNQIKELEKKIATLAKNILKEGDITNRQRIFELEQEIKNLKPPISKETPVPLINEIQNKIINNSTAIIEYRIGLGQKIYAFYITKDNFNIIPINPDIGWELEINILRELLKNEGDLLSITENEQKLMEISHSIYNTLLAPIKIQNNIKQLIIVPDGIISKIPFDFLTKKTATTFDAGEYLVYDYAISFANSITLLKQQLNVKVNKAEHLYGAFFLDADNCKKNLKNINSSLTNMANKLGTTSHNNTTTTIFKREAPKYHIMAIGAHTKINKDNPYYSSILFAPEDGFTCENEINRGITFAEINAMQLKAQVVILLNCEAGSSLNKSEDALAYAFNYAGVPSFFAPLWNLPDPSTKDINNYLTTNLIKGEIKPIALQNAKIRYLNKHKNGAGLKLHPYHWAALVNYGNFKSIENIPWWKHWEVIIRDYLNLDEEKKK